MKVISLTLAFVISLAIAGASGETCFEYIKYISYYDQILASRGEVKTLAGQITVRPAQFQKVFTRKEYKDRGTEYSSEHTRSWVTEMFQTVKKQYKEYRGNEKGRNSYISYTASELYDYFESFKESDKWRTFQLRFLGTHEHDWVIEQLPDLLGYRIYQSSHQGYSLYSWLSSEDKEDSLSELFTSSHIMLPYDLKQKVDARVQSLTQGANSLYDLEGIDESLEELLPYLEYVRDYSMEDSIENFKRAWESYGKGKIISQRIFFESGGYLEKLTEMVSYFETYDGTTELVPDGIWESWIELFGSPDLLYYPGIPNSQIFQLLVGERNFSFEVKMFELKKNISKQNKICGNNGKIIERALDLDEVEMNI